MKPTIYERAATALSRYDFTASELEVILGCSAAFAAHLRSSYGRFKCPSLMQAKFNEASRLSKARKRMNQMAA